MATKTKTKTEPMRLSTAGFKAAAEVESIVSDAIPATDLIAGGKVHELPTFEAKRFLVTATKGKKWAKDLEFVIFWNDAQNNVSPDNHYFRTADSWVNAKTGKVVLGVPAHTSLLNAKRDAMAVSLLDALMHARCGAASLNKRDDETVTKAYGHSGAGRHNAEFVGFAREYWDTFAKYGDEGVTRKQENSPRKLNVQTARMISDFVWNEKLFTVERVTPTGNNDGKTKAKAIRLVCEIHEDYIISIPVKTQAKHEVHDCAAITSKSNAKQVRRCHKILIAKE
jgi:hypothetical protein